MSFMYKSMMTRGPGKRKIKLQEENILHLMQGDDEDDDEEDDDFQVTEDQQLIAEESCDDSESSSDSSTSSDEDSSSDKEIPTGTTSKTLATEPSQRQSQSHHRCKRQPYESPTIQSTNAMIRSRMNGASNSTVEILKKMNQQLKVSTSGVLEKCDLSLQKICCVCLSKRNASGIIVCSQCRISLHKDCYGGMTSSKLVAHGSIHWFCSSCISGVPPSCEFCPSTNGCIKETTNGQWCHVTCARYILGKEMYPDGNNKELIDTFNLNYKEYGSRECSLCDDRLLAKTGICVQCDAGFCKSYFHVTCAQKYGLLSENESQNCDTDPYFVYCSLHMGREKMIQTQKLYRVVFAAVNFTKNANVGHDTRQKDKMMNLLKRQRNLYVQSQHKRYPTSPARGTPPARELTSNAVTMKILNRKAEIMFGFDQRSPAVYFPKPSDVRKRHHVTPALTGEFMSHYADRELRLVEMQERIQSVVNENKALVTEQAGLKENYQKLENDLASQQQRENNIVKTSRTLFSMFSRLKVWANENKAMRSSPIKKFLPLKPETRASINPLIKCRSPNRKRVSSAVTEGVVKKATKVSTPKSPGLLKTCGICGGDKQQHLLVDCDVCKRWLHLGCLDPPLTQFPKKTKFSLWQCSDCVSSSSDDSDAEDDIHGSHITSEGRRHTRRSRKPPEKLSTMLINNHTYKQQKKMINRISRMYQRSYNKPKRYFGARVQQHARQTQNSPRGLKVHADQEIKQTMRTKRKPFVPDSQTINLTEHDEKVSETGVAARCNTSLDSVASAPSLPSFSRHANTTQRTSPMLTVNLPTKINKPITLRATPSMKLPRSAIPIKPMEKSDLIASTSAILSSKSIQQSTTSLKDTGHVDVEQCWPTHSSASNSSVSIIKKESREAVPMTCVVCKDAKNNEQMMFCHSCKNSYHIWCCDPPLSSRIRLNKHFSWECSRCHPTEDVEEDTTCAGSETTQDGRRKITRRRRPPEKFANIFYSCSQQKMLNSVLQRTNRIRTQKDRRRNLQRKIKKFSISLGSTTQKMDYNFIKVAPKPTALNSIQDNKQNGDLDGETSVASSKNHTSDPVSTCLQEPKPNLPAASLTKPTTFRFKRTSSTILPYVVSDDSFQKTQASIKAAVSELLSWELMSRVNVRNMPTKSQIMPKPVSNATLPSLNKSTDSKVPESPSKLLTVVLPKPPSIRSLPKNLTTAKVAQNPLPIVEKSQTSPPLAPSSPTPREAHDTSSQSLSASPNDVLPHVEGLSQPQPSATHSDATELSRSREDSDTPLTGVSKHQKDVSKSQTSPPLASSSPTPRETQDTSAQEGTSSQSLSAFPNDLLPHVEGLSQPQPSATHSDATELSKSREDSDTPLTGVCNPVLDSSLETTASLADNALQAELPDVCAAEVLCHALSEPVNHVTTHAQPVGVSTDAMAFSTCTSSSANPTECKSSEIKSDQTEVSSDVS